MLAILNNENHHYFLLTELSLEVNEMENNCTAKRSNFTFCISWLDALLPNHRGRQYRYTGG